MCHMFLFIYKAICLKVVSLRPWCVGLYTLATSNLMLSLIILWRACCRSTVNSGNACLQPLLSNATMEGTVVFFEVRSGNDFIQQRNQRRCFLCGLFPGYIARTSTAMIGQFRVMARDAIRVGCRVGAGVFRGREETQLLWVVKCNTLWPSCVTDCDPINPVVNPIPVYSHLTRDNIYVFTNITRPIKWKRYDGRNM
jgi:hypothetical protein